MAATASPKAVLIVTGAWLLPNQYRKVVQGLEAKGVRVLCPRLISNDNAAIGHATLADDVALIREVAASEVAEGTQLTVLAHSYGGVVSSAALADLAPPKRGAGGAGGGVVNLVFAAALVPVEGSSPVDLFGGVVPPWMVRNDDDGTLEVPGPQALQYFFNDLPADEAGEAAAALTLHPLRVPLEKIRCGAVAWRTVPVSYLICENDTAMPPAIAQQSMIDRVRKEGVEVRVFRCDGGHCPFLSVPDKVVEVVLEVMKSS